MVDVKIIYRITKHDTLFGLLFERVLFEDTNKSTKMNLPRNYIRQNDRS
jgi:hypothetical protein